MTVFSESATADNGFSFIVVHISCSVFTPVPAMQKRAVIITTYFLIMARHKQRTEIKKKNISKVTGRVMFATATIFTSI